ncbi:MAG: hypothetical protein COA78_00620 [Blastopirellula sp.]|nr:MAG: hypothetical protein COA78_00620 [Blastopirellula sp.]
MLKFLACLYLIALASPALAQDWSLRLAGTQLGQVQARAVTAGTMPTVIDDGQSRVQVEGAYSHTYATKSSIKLGIFRVDSGGRVCIDFRIGVGRCGRYVHSKGILVTLIERGGRFPIRVHLDLRP